MAVRPRRNEEGSALVLALIAVFLLLIVSFEVAHTSRIETFITKNVEVDAQLEAACRSGLERALAILREDRQNTELDSTNDAWHALFVDNELTPADVASEEFLLDDEGEEEEQVTLYIEMFDENAKFNVFRLATRAERKRREDVRRFAELIDRFRDEWSDFDLGAADGQEIGDQILSFITRDEDKPFGTLPTPPTKKPGGMNDVAELLYIPGIDPSILWDQTTNEGETLVPGLFRFVTIWTDMQVNINTAPLPVLASLFEPKNVFLAERIIDARDNAEEEREREESSLINQFEESRGENEPDPTGGAPFTQIADLRDKVEGIGDEVYSKLAPWITVQSDVFSIFVTAEKGLLRRTKMWVVKRGESGFQILMERPVDFPYFIPPDRMEKGEQDAEGRYQ
ncbi:MAG TPA: hypothetical protein ENK43_10800 [Planctomycetes bacterium]|nr:hypothetical protein [Planctomycetota bacterium]